MRTPFILVLLTVLFNSTVFAQTKPSITFENLTHDYGTIKEEAGRQECIFIFKNTGNADLQVTNVRASCGCTTSDYTKELVKPGKKGFVKVVYDATNRPGPFHKSVNVTTNDPDNANVNLFIKGDVSPRQKTILDEYPLAQGRLRFVTNHANMQLSNNQIYTDTIKMYNHSDTALEMKIDRVPAHITKLEVKPQILGPKQKGIIVYTYDAGKKNDYGYVYDRLNFTSNDPDIPIKNVFVSATINEDFSKLTPEELKNAPKVSFESEMYKFENISTGEVVNHDFILTNNGKRTLKIRKVKAACGCTAIRPEKMELEPGESTKIGTAFNTSGRKGNQSKTVTVTTNDPERPTVILTISGEILEKVNEIKGDASKGEGGATIYKLK